MSAVVAAAAAFAAIFNVDCRMVLNSPEGGFTKQFYFERVTHVRPWGQSGISFKLLTGETIILQNLQCRIVKGKAYPDGE